jgi:hypothetical protein
VAVLGFRNRVLAEGKIGADLRVVWGVEFNCEKTNSQFVVAIE